MKRIIPYLIALGLIGACGNPNSDLGSLGNESPHEMPDPSESKWNPLDGPDGSDRGSDGSKADSPNPGVDVKGQTFHERSFSPSDFKAADYRVAQIEMTKYSGHDPRKTGVRMGSGFRVGGYTGPAPNRGAGSGEAGDFGWGSESSSPTGGGQGGSKGSGSGQVPGRGGSGGSGNPGGNGGSSIGQGSGGGHEPPHADRNQGTRPFERRYSSIERFKADLSDQEQILQQRFESVRETEDGSSFNYDAVKDAVHNSHNKFVKQAQKLYPGVAAVATAAAASQLTPFNTIDGKKIAMAKGYLQYVKSKPLPKDLTPETKLQLLSVAKGAISIADKLYNAGDKDPGDVALSVALTALDVTLDFVPGVSFIKDVTSLATGYNPITGEKLTDFDKAMIVGGLFLPSTLSGSAKVLGKVAKAAKHVNGAFAKNVVDGATSYLGKGKRFSPIKHGPLHKMDEGAGTVADTFRGGSYTEFTLEAPTTFHRVHSARATGNGKYLSRNPSRGTFQAKLDSALNPDWGNTATHISKIEVPAGTKIYHGASASQPVVVRKGGPQVGNLHGGGDQIYIEHVPAAWVKETRPL